MRSSVRSRVAKNSRGAVPGFTSAGHTTNFLVQVRIEQLLIFPQENRSNRSFTIRSSEFSEVSVEAIFKFTESRFTARPS